MAKKPRTPAQLANDERLRNRKKQENTPRPEPTTAPEPPQEDKKVEVSESLLYKLMNEIEELKKNPHTPDEALKETAKITGATVSNQGVQGIQIRYPIDKGYYPDPTERLYNEPRLKRMALRENFIFEWDVEGVNYEQYGVAYAEPRFIVELSRKLFDDEGNERMDKKAFVNRIYLHEDDYVARLAAQKFPELQELDTTELLNEVRYMRMRDWLLAIFYPEKIRARSGDITTIIDGRPVTLQDREEFVDADSGNAMGDTIRRQTAL